MILKLRNSVLIFVGKNDNNPGRIKVGLNKSSKNLIRLLFAISELHFPSGLHEL